MSELSFDVHSTFSGEEEEDDGTTPYETNQKFNSMSPEYRCLLLLSKHFLNTGLKPDEYMAQYEWPYSTSSPWRPKRKKKRLSEALPKETSVIFNKQKLIQTMRNMIEMSNLIHF